MRLATIIDGGRLSLAVVRDDRILPIDGGEELASVRAIAAAGGPALERVSGLVGGGRADDAARPIEAVELGPAVPDPGAIYTIGLNYRDPEHPADPGPERPVVFGKAASSVAAHRSRLHWDRTLTDNVDAECELGVVIGAEAVAVGPEEAMAHVFGYTIIDDVSSRDPWLDGDQWLIGKSLPGFCPAGPWVVTADELDADDLGLGTTINGVAIQDGSTSQMRFGIAEIVSFLSRHLTLRPGDLIATGTPVRLSGPLGPDRHLRIGDEVTTWIEGIGELTTFIG